MNYLWLLERVTAIQTLANEKQHDRLLTAIKCLKLDVESAWLQERRQNNEREEHDG